MRQNHQRNPARLMRSIQYTGTNYEKVKAFCGDRLLAPYFCMGFTMLSLLPDEGFVTVNEGDTIVVDDLGQFRVQR